MIITHSSREAKEKAAEGHTSWNQIDFFPCLFGTQVIVQQQQKIYENTLNEAFYFPLKRGGKQK
jgi:hypothetical protein